MDFEMKLQTPSSNIQRNFKRPSSKTRVARLGLNVEVWSFSGAWMLEFGAFFGTCNLEL
jgi:hypothetical protein